MRIDTSELCDIYQDQIDVVEPIFPVLAAEPLSAAKSLLLNALRAMA